ncbi:MAG: amidohydrolase, partial [Gammaproteobacteria bacterium]|nr:amidohydrolase [Gammaproteobacteria bacterium]
MSPVTTLRVALVQQPLIWHDPAANRTRFAELLEPLAGRADLIVLPETFTTGFSMEVERIAEPAAAQTGQWLTELAARLDSAVTGSVITLEAGRCYNRLLWAAPGAALRHYDKRY